MAIEKTFGARWRVIAVLGKGGQGVVYKVGDTDGLPSQQELDKTIKEGLRKASEQMIQCCRLEYEFPNVRRIAVRAASYLHPRGERHLPEASGDVAAGRELACQAIGRHHTVFGHLRAAAGKTRPYRTVNGIMGDVIEYE